MDETFIKYFLFISVIPMRIMWLNTGVQFLSYANMSIYVNTLPSNSPAKTSHIVRETII